MSITFDSEVQFSALIFDCDGTLLDTATLYYQALNKVLQDDKVQISKTWFQAHSGMTIIDLLKAFQKERCLKLNVEAIAVKMIQFYLENLDNLKEIEAVTSIARKYKGIVPMAVASNGHKEAVVSSLKKTGLLLLFDSIVTIDDVKNGKPAPDLFLKAAECLNVLPEQCFIFEDSNEGLEAAHLAKIPAYDVRKGFGMQHGFS